MALSSPGTQVTIIDESQYLPAAPNSVPLIVIATAQNKVNAAGTGVAVGTTAANANKLYAITSQRDLVTYFGNPFFYKTTNGTPIQGYELNEYGLLAAYSALGTTDLAYVIRADVDLAGLVGRTGRPSAAVANGTYWLNTASSTWGIFEFNSVTGIFTNKIPRIITSGSDLSGGAPLNSIGNIGDYAVTDVFDYGQPDDYSTYWFKNSENQWVAVGSSEWQGSLATVQGTQAPTAVTVGNLVIKKNTAAISVTGYIDDASAPGTYSGVAGTTLTVTGVVSGTITVGTYISGTGITPGTYVTAVGPVVFGRSTYTVSTPQARDDAPFTGYNAYTIPVRTAPNNTVANLATDINAQNIPFLSAAVSGGRLTLYSTQTGGVVEITADSTPGTLTSLGIDAGEYAAPALSYGTNAQQPRWRSTDASPHPTGSVWIKTNNVNSGVNLVMSQYNQASGIYLNKTVTVAQSDWAVNATLDSSGGRAIPVNTVYAQAGYYSAGESFAAPVQLFTRTSTGISVFVGSTTTPSFTDGAEFLVQVSSAGSSDLSSVYTVTIVGTSAASFVTAWTAANIPNTTATVSATGAIVLSHTQGGVIIMDDTPSVDYGVASPIVAAGFTTYDFGSGVGTFGAKYGPYKTVDHTTGTPVAVTTSGAGAGLTVEVSTTGFAANFTIAAAGSGYAINEQLSVAIGGVTYYLAVTSTGNLGAVTGLELVSGDAIPEYTVQLSNWESFEYIADTTAPVAAPADNTPWFYSVANQVDIMTNYGGEWYGYNNIAYGTDGLPVVGTNAGNNPTGPICQASEPEAQVDGTPLVYGDLWIDTGDLENYPVIYRWQQVNDVDQWVLIDNTDQTTENGILFADARWGDSGSVDPVNDPIPSIASLLSSDYLDLDAPSGSEYPQGTMLFNTRRSGYNVKEFKKNYFNATAFPDTTLPQFTNAWVTVSGNQTNGAPYMGRKAQRAMVVQAMKTCIDTSTQLREDETYFNLMAAPNYCEVQPNMVALNNDRGNTSYIIGDTPLRLADDANAIIGWATNAVGATSTSEEGLVTRDTYLGIYYPSAITTDLTGTQVVVPPSHMMLRVILRNDAVAYPWFAPAGQRRGVVDNATNIGYIDAATGEFVTTKNRVGLRDVEYNNFINPIAFFTNLGLLNYGNKNSFDSQSALDRTNVARLICYLRDRLQIAVRPFLFEPNDSITRTQVRGVVQTLLADIMSKRGIYDYLVVCDESNNTPARIDRNELWVDIAIEPTKAVEFIYIPVRILNTGEISGVAQNG